MQVIAVARRSTLPLCTLYVLRYLLAFLLRTAVQVDVAASLQDVALPSLL